MKREKGSARVPSAILDWRHDHGDDELLDGCVGLLLEALLDVLIVPVDVLGTRVYRVFLTGGRQFLVRDDVLLVLVLVVLVGAGRDVRLAASARAPGGLFVAPASRCNKQPHKDIGQRLSLNKCGIFRLFYFTFLLLLFF